MGAASNTSRDGQPAPKDQQTKSRSKALTVGGIPVVKVKALKDFKINDYNENECPFVPFNKGQEFFVLMADPGKMLYFVTTNLSAPFSKGALCGLADMDMFTVSGS